MTIALSIITGFILSLSRLYDLRLTSNIVLTRLRALDKNVTIEDKQSSKSSFVESLKSLFLVFCKYQDYEISKCKIADTQNFRDKFAEVQQKANDLGVSTWGLVKCQTLSMLFGILFFILALAIK